VRARTAASPYAHAFLALVEALGVAPEATGAGERGAGRAGVRRVAPLGG
jgi:hypothetical protein